MKNRIKKNMAGCLLLLSIMAGAQKNFGKVALINATVHVGNGRIINGGLVVIHNDKIETVGEIAGIKLQYKSFDTVIDLTGQHLYPGLINTNNVLGLHDAEAVRATLDFAEVGSLNPHIRAVIAYNTDNLIIPTVKTNGILYTQVTPRGGLISGSSSVMALEGWNWEDALLLADDGIHVNFPESRHKKYGQEDEQAVKNAAKYTDEVAALTRLFSDAVAYGRGNIPANETNLRLEALRPVLNGRANLYLHADEARDILAAIGFSKKFRIARTVIVGGKEAYKVTKELKSNGIPVMLNRVNDLPDRTDDDVDIVYRTPYLLQRDSVLFCLQLEGDMEAMQSRNLPFNAGAAVAYGLTKEQALAAVSFNAARITGADKWLGTIEAGKLASLVVSTGDILDMRTNNVTLAYIAGKQVTLSNRQTELYNKYKTKYGIR